MGTALPLRFLHFLELFSFFIFSKLFNIRKMDFALYGTFTGIPPLILCFFFAKFFT